MRSGRCTAPAKFLDAAALITIVVLLLPFLLRLPPPPPSPVRQVGDECGTPSHYEIRSPVWRTLHSTILIAQKNDYPDAYKLAMDSHVRHTPEALLALYVPVPVGNCNDEFDSRMSTIRNFVKSLRAKGLKVHWMKIRNIGQWVANTPLQGVGIQQKHLGVCHVEARHWRFWAAHVSDLLHALGLYHFGGLAKDANVGTLRNFDFLWAGLGSNMVSLWSARDSVPAPRLGVPWFSAEPRTTVPLSWLWVLAVWTRKNSADRVWPFDDRVMEDFQMYPDYDETGEIPLSAIVLQLIRHGFRIALVSPERIVDYTSGSGNYGPMPPHETLQLPQSGKSINLINFPYKSDCDAERWNDHPAAPAICGSSKGVLFRRPYSFIVLSDHYVHPVVHETRLALMVDKLGKQAMLDRLDSAFFYEFWGEENNFTELLHSTESRPLQEVWRHLVNLMCLTLCELAAVQPIDAN